MKQVIDFLRKKKTIKIKNEIGSWQSNHEKYLNEYEKIINGRDLIYGSSIFYEIILDDRFLDNVANSNPYLFAEVIKELNDPVLKEDEFVNRFLKILMINKNGKFFREIKNNQNIGEYNAYSIDSERPILFALFDNIKVSSINQAWRGIGEPAIIEMHKEAKMKYSVLREPDIEKESDTTWSFRITIAIWYFDIMVRQAIKQDIADHMWMFYYRHFLTALISNMSDLPFEDSDLNRRSRNFDLIESIFSKMMDWKSVIMKSKNSTLLKNVYNCIGQCIYELATTNKIRDQDKHYLINWVWEDLIKTFGEDDRSAEIVNDLIEFGFQMFLRPTILFSPDLTYKRDESRKYLSAIRKLWDERDIPILTGTIGKRAEDFKTRVVDKLIT